MRHSSSVARVVLGATLFFLPAAPAAAQTAPPCPTAVLTVMEAADLLRLGEAEVERLASEGSIPARRVATTFRFNCEALLSWLAEAAKRRPETGAASQGQTAVIGEAPEEREAGDVFLRGQRVLLDRGDVVLDVGGFYGRNSEQVLAAVGGGIALATVEQSTFTTLLLGRVGVFDETELFLGTAFHAGRTRQFFGATDLANSRRRELAGIQLGVRRTLVREDAGRPDVIVSVSGQVPAGDAPSAAGTGVVVVKRVDPVVLFANGNYFRVFAGSDARTRSARNRGDLSMGYGLALNDTLAISMSVSAVFSGSLLFDDESLRQSGRYAARFGLTSWLAKGLYVEPSISFGLAGPGHYVVLGVTVPYTF